MDTYDETASTLVNSTLVDFSHPKYLPQTLHSKRSIFYKQHGILNLRFHIDFFNSLFV